MGRLKNSKLTEKDCLKVRKNYKGIEKSSCMKHKQIKINIYNKYNILRNYPQHKGSNRKHSGTNYK